MTRLRTVAQSLMAEAKGMTRKMPGVKVIVLVYDSQDSALTALHDDQVFDWDAVSSRLRATAEEIRSQGREWVK